ncbi:hypothetical protein PVL29_018438 [Vitis rotundifolia]|uniref:Uncharacterized protein n=1 Tax=Vitis rotundifolia TaxID=103349 RepID=A0AA38Z586_VITRO|nr:hypothetical protein PVL29_018438 [Vitis rotundifolia]
MEEILKRVPCFIEVKPSSTKMSNFFLLMKRISMNLDDNPLFLSQPSSHLVVAGVWNLLRQCALLFERLEVAEAIKAFVTQQIGSSEELCTKRERAESDLAAAQKATTNEAEALIKAEKEKKTAKAEACQPRKERKAVEAKFKHAEQENDRLKKKLEELRARFAAQKKELEGEYQKQVDDMFFFDYQCCMTKNDITQDTPNYPYDDDDAAADTSTQGNGVPSTADPSGGQ